MTLDPSAFDALYSAHAPAVYRSALGIVRDPDAAADVVQETFVRAYTATDEIVSPAAWLGTVARRLALNELRRRGRLTGLTEDATDDEPAHGTTLVESAVWTDPAKSAASADSVAVAAACLDELRPDDRTLLTFRYGEGLDIGAIAGLLGRTVNATTVALHRARARFDAAYANRVFRRAGVPESCRAWRADAVAHADGKPASAEYIRHLATCAPCQETDADLRSRSKAFAFAPLLGLPLVVPATLKATVIAGLAGKGIAVGAVAGGAAAAGGATSTATGATASAAATGGGSAATGISAKIAFVAIAGFIGVAGLAATVGPMLLAGGSGAPTGTAAPSEMPGIPITTDGSPLTLTVATARQNAIATFACTEGVRYGAKITTDVPHETWFKGPDGVGGYPVGPFTYGEWTATRGGTCSLLFDPNDDATGSATVQVWAAEPADVKTTVTTDGSPVTLDAAVPFQNAIATFACTEGVRYGAKITTDVPHETWFKGPDGVGGYPVGPFTYGEWTATRGGTCSLLFDPNDDATGSATVSIVIVP